MCTYTLIFLDPNVSFSSYSQFDNGTVVFKIPGSDVEPNREYDVFFEISNAAGSINTSTTTFSIYYNTHGFIGKGYIAMLNSTVIAMMT